MANTQNKLERNPIVVVLGHVDHGKTSLLDAIRNTTVQKGEPGGITQNIYISNVEWKGQTITFVDTPGHEVFSLMRLNGGKVADLAFLIVAADEGVQPQTLESIDIIQSNKMKYIVVITKCDKEGANVEKVKTELMTRGVYLEGAGGDIPFIEVSAVTKVGIDKLLDLVYLFSDVESLLTVDTERMKLMEVYGDLAEQITLHGVVLDSSIGKAFGKQVFGVIRYGTIKKGDSVMFGPTKERVGLLFDANMKPLNEVTAGMSFIATGLTELPMNGVDILNSDSQEVDKFLEEKYAVSAGKMEMSSDELMSTIFGDNDKIIIPIVLRTDVHASLLSILPSFKKFNNDKVEVKVVSSGVGAITVSDVDNAKTFHSILIGFRVKTSKEVADYARSLGVTLSTFDIVYHLFDLLQEFIKKATSGGDIHEEVIGTAKVKKVFVLSDGEVVAGCVITDGMAKRNSIARVIREGVTVADYVVGLIKVIKEEKREVKKGTECGINLGKTADVKEGDNISFIVK